MAPSWLRRGLDAIMSAQPVHAPAASVPVDPPNVAQLRHYAHLCRRAGVDRLYLLLTFDCDTNEDIDAARVLDTDLRRRAIRAGYAVPGAQLRTGADTWRRIALGGAEFLNHGDRPHAEWRDGRYRPVTFYNELTEPEIVADITDGHRATSEVIGVPPVGFRAPHFGSFQEPAQLDLLYRTLRPLGYRYCSGTLPAVALARGPVVDMGGITEIPTMGSYRHPTTLLDSWTYLSDRTQYALGDEYFELFEETVRRMIESGSPGILTYYADPSHVLGQKPFERALDLVGQYGLPTLLGRDAARQFHAV